MLNGIKSYLFLVVDQETKGILTKCSSITIANAVVKGILNSSSMLVPYSNINNTKINTYSENTIDNYKLVRFHNSKFSNFKPMTGEANVYEIGNNKEKKAFDLVEMDQSSINNLWIEKRTLANFRANKIRTLESFCERYSARLVNFFGDELLFQNLSNELSKVDVKNNDYPISIIEWAEINNISPNAAYKELKLQYESTTISIMRIHAIWNKYVEKINQLNYNQEDQADDLIHSLEAEFKWGEK